VDNFPISWSPEFKHREKSAQKFPFDIYLLCLVVYPSQANGSFASLQLAFGLGLGSWLDKFGRVKLEFGLSKALLGLK